MNKKITLDPSIATLLDINPVAENERIVVNFTASENWTGDFEFVVYNSIAKNNFVKPTAAVVAVAKVMSLTIDPKVQGISVDAHYYEIVSVGVKRVLFKGLLNVIK